ncbi:sensor domain-containing diguanylate cyclase [Massilia sp. IC2-476]|uniref:sensor domain-containing diguanylate cyclase n=1 Tax=Massilia sp. IC2-476 TaxID=2887199 RepID=UPI001D127570|nr:sensor domain-containing diguanylate cyclase [Massilia sp. IC2-476]MCC2970804.1 diguanylate cyclase [Massilia sp. IC2-476]
MLPPQSDYYRAAFAQSDAGMAMLSLEGQWIDVNPALCRMLGYSRTALLERDCSEISHPDDHAADRAWVARLRGGEADSFGFEKRYRQQSGALIWGLLSATLCRDSRGEPQFIVVHIVDISAQKKALEDRDALFALSPDLLSVTTPDGYIVQANPAWRALLGWDNAALMARPFMEFIHPDDASRTMQQAQAIAHGGSVMGFRNRFRHADGGWRWIEWSTRVADDGRMFCLGRDVSEQRRMSEQLHYRATHDFLTGLPNRYEFMGRLQQAIDALGREPRPLVLLFIDLDGFKTVNDLCGHETGDVVLTAFGQRLAASVRRTDTVARLAGDEFVVLLDHLGDPWQDADQVAGKILRAASQPYPELAGLTEPGASIGMALYQPGDSADRLLSRADAAMYVAKKAGKNRAAFQRDGRWVVHGA